MNIDADKVDFDNLDQMAKDAWLFLTADNMPKCFLVNREAFGHEVKAMLENVRQHHAKKVAIDYAHWLLKRVFPHSTSDAPTPEAEKLFDIFLNETQSK